MVDAIRRQKWAWGRLVVKKAATKKKAVAKKVGAAAPRPCGVVNHGVPPKAPAVIKGLILKVAGPQWPANTPDQTKITEFRVGADLPYQFVVECMKYPAFMADGLGVDRLYVIDNVKDLGTLVTCIRCCYQHPRSG